MRASLLKDWPALSRLYGIHPGNFRDLTPAELAEYLSDLSELRARG